jgi:hypothetical protein
LLHITNGDVLAERINHLPGDILPWREMYDYGPLIHTEIKENALSERAKFFEKRIGIPQDLFISNCNNQENKLNEIDRDTVVTLWFEHDRYDQLMLVYLLNRLHDLKINQIKIVSINNHDSIEQFQSLSQLSRENLSELFLSKVDITIEQLVEAKKVWEMYTNSDPTLLLNWLEKGENKLPFLKKALQAHFEFYPNIKDGLSTVERLCLRKLQPSPKTFKQLLSEINIIRNLDGMSDLHLSALLKSVFPLIEINGYLPEFTNFDSDPILQLSQDGKLVLEGKINRLTCSKIDWWLGGVHLNEIIWCFKNNKLYKKSFTV